MITPANNPKLFAVVTNADRRPAAAHHSPQHAPQHVAKKGAAERRAARHGELKTKTAIDRAAKLLDRLELRAKACAAEAAFWSRRKAFALARVEAYEERILTLMDAAGIALAPGVERQFKLAPCPTSVDVVNAAEIPLEFMRQPKTPAAAPDKRAIAQAIEAGQSVPGTRLVQNISLKRS